MAAKLQLGEFATELAAPEPARFFIGQARIGLEIREQNTNSRY
jgi:hypothetical protein